ncbi:MAG: glycoside hydrolase family 3 N-terminal domain-containing protein [Saprospiraceae bacterium]
MKPALVRSSRLPAAALLVALFALSANPNNRFNLSRDLDPREAVWVDSMFNTLSADERLGQLFMIRAHSDLGPEHEHAVEDIIRNHRVGGLCFFQGTPEHQAALTNRYQALSDKLPLLISMDAEWGLGMRLKENAISFPKQIMLGAIRDNRLIYDMGRDLARQCRRLGVHINFAPVADVNNNPANPVINDRSFGEDRNNVATKCFQYMMGLQDGGVLACAKHFPGHGDTDVDSHLDLPLISHRYGRLDSLEMFPFRAMALHGVGGVMVAHLSVPALDPRPNQPTTLSRPVVTQILRNQLGFEGLIITDAMEMKGVTKYFHPGYADVEALRAGNDIVLLPNDVGAAIAAIRAALLDGSLDPAQVDESVRRVLRAKYRLGLVQPQRVDTTNIRRDLHRPESLLLKRRLVQHALTLVRDRTGAVGFENIEKYRFATLALGDTNRTVFQSACGFFAPMAHFNLPKNMDSLPVQHLLDTLRTFDVVLVSLHDMSRKPETNFGLSPARIALVQRLCEQGNTVVLTIFGNPYCLKFFESAPVVLQAYNEDETTQELAAQALFGASDLDGVLPVTAAPSARQGQGIERSFTIKRMGYDLPEAVGLSSDTLRLMDGIVADLIAEGAAPGCQILVAKDGKIVWHKAYGHYTYDSTARRVALDDLYDLASITKVAATTLAVMHRVDAGLMALDKPMSSYVPELAGTDKKSLTVSEILAHHAGLQPWIPFYEKTLIGLGRPSPEVYCPVAMTCYEVPVAKDLYMADDYVDTVWSRIFASPLRTERTYKYSDLGLYLTARALQNLNGQPLDVFANRIFYRPMGLATAMFNPWRAGLAERCIPTEDDAYFRQQRLQGYVHDMGAAMLGGVSGHAGLFSNANDLAKIFQMLLNKGQYAGRRYLRTETVKRFTSRYPGSTRRGIGFDMKELNPAATQNMSALASPNTFGHTGFTGNAVWADPDNNLIFVFLSNRTFPSMTNNKLINGDYRPRLQGVVYRAMGRVEK